MFMFMKGKIKKNTLLSKLKDRHSSQKFGFVLLMHKIYFENNRWNIPYLNASRCLNRKIFQQNVGNLFIFLYKNIFLCGNFTQLNNFSASVLRYIFIFQTWSINFLSYYLNSHDSLSFYILHFNYSSIWIFDMNIKVILFQVDIKALCSRLEWN